LDGWPGCQLLACHQAVYLASWLVSVCQVGQLAGGQPVWLNAWLVLRLSSWTFDRLLDGWLVLSLSAWSWSGCQLGRLARAAGVSEDGQGGGDAVRLDGWSSCQLGRLASGEAVCMVGWLLIELPALMVGWC